MIILNRALRREFALPGFCEWCGAYCRKREGHHLRTRTPELTIRINLFSVGSSPLFACACHTRIGDGNIDRADVLKRVAVRERCNVEDITAVMDLFRRLVRPTHKQLQEALMELEPMQHLLAVQALGERVNKLNKLNKTSVSGPDRI